MPEWSDKGVILSVKPYGENKGIVSLLTAEKGRHAGLVHAVDSRSKRGIFEPGNLVEVDWRARLSEQLGTFQIELVKNSTALMLDQPLRLAGLSSLCAVLDVGLPEREPVSLIWQATIALMDIISLAEAEEDWLPFYIRWEIEFLRQMGFALGLDKCAVSGLTDNLVYVSPKSGNAIHADYTGEYTDRMLALPAFLLSEQSQTHTAISSQSLSDGLHLTGHFLGRRIFDLLNRDLPQPRLRLAHLVAKRYNNT